MVLPNRCKKVGPLQMEVLITVMSVVEYPRLERLKVSPIKLPIVRLGLVAVATTTVLPLSALVSIRRLGCSLCNTPLAWKDFATTMLPKWGLTKNPWETLPCGTGMNRRMPPGILVC